jgi:hypothetical protein
MGGGIVLIQGFETTSKRCQGLLRLYSPITLAAAQYGDSLLQ